MVGKEVAEPSARTRFGLVESQRVVEVGDIGEGSDFEYTLLLRVSGGRGDRQSGTRPRSIDASSLLPKTSRTVGLFRIGTRSVQWGPIYRGPGETSTYLAACPPHNCSSLRLVTATGLVAADAGTELQVLRVSPGTDAAPTATVTVAFDRPVRVASTEASIRAAFSGSSRRFRGGWRRALRRDPLDARSRHPPHPGARPRRAAGRDLDHSRMTDGAIHSLHDDHAHHPPARHHRHDHHHRRLRRLGCGRRRLGLRLGPAGRRRVDRRDPACRRAGDQLDRHRGGLRAGPLGGGRPARARRRSREASGPTSSPSAAWSGTSRTGWPRPGRTCVPPPSARSARRRSAASASSASISTSSTGPTRPARRWRTPGPSMVRLIEEGKVRAAGVSNFDVDLLDRCEAVRHVDSLQPPFSLIRRQAADGGDPLVRGARRPASSCTARCSRAS